MTRAIGRLMHRHLEGPRGQLIGMRVPPAIRVHYTTPGQYCVLHAEGETGIFAIAQAPGSEPFEFYIQPGGGSADVIVRLPIGAEIGIDPPDGAGYRIDEALAAGGPIFALATGSGLSGLRAALQALDAEGRQVDLSVGFRTPADLLFEDDLEGWRRGGWPVQRVFSRGLGASYVQHALRARAPDLSDAWVLACGQPAMQVETQRICAELGLRPGRFLTNY